MRTPRCRKAVRLATAFCVLVVAQMYACAFCSINPQATAIAWMKLLPDGAAVCINQKVVTSIWLTHFYIEEADRSAGIKIFNGNHYTPSRLEQGNLISLSGVMATNNEQRVIYASSSMECADTNMVGKLDPLGMSSPAIVGWPPQLNMPTHPTAHGLMPIGLRIRIWGRVTASSWSDADGYFLYLDDGWGKKDGTDINVTGIRVYSNSMPPLNQMLVATGVLAYKTYDPTPNGPGGDDFRIPVLMCNSSSDLSPPGNSNPTPGSADTITGRLRLVNENLPGKTVRVYSQKDSVLLDNVTDDYTPFSLPNIPTSGAAVTASVVGYVSSTRIAKGGDTDVDFDLNASSTSVELQSDKQSLRSCTTDSTLLRVLVRDCEGKGLSGRDVKLTTNRGQFGATGQREIMVTTDNLGNANASMNTGVDGPGLALVTAADYPAGQFTNKLNIEFIGPQVEVSANPQYITQSGNSAIKARVLSDGAAIPRATILFTSNQGVFQESGTKSFIAVADDLGYARATLYLASAGTATVLATYSNGCSQDVIKWTWVAYKTAPFYNVGANKSNPLVVDLDGAPDAHKEIVIITDTAYLVALNTASNVLWSKEIHAPWTCTASCAMLDTGPNARPSLFVPAEGQPKLFGFAYDGAPIAGWPIVSTYHFQGVASAIGDMNLDGSLEVVCGDYSCYVWSWNPTGDWKKTGTANSSFLWRNLTGSPNTTISGSSCAIGDVDNNGIPDAVVGAVHSTPLFAFPGDLWGDFTDLPVYTNGYPKAAGNKIESSPAIGDIDGDGKNDLAVGCSDNNIYLRLSSNGSWVGYPTGGPITSSPALADLDGNGKLDVIVGSQSGKLFAIDWQGQAIVGWGGGIKLNSNGEFQINSSPVAGDVNGDGKVEIVVGSDDGNLYALYPDGREHRISNMLTGPIAWIKCCVPPDSALAQVLSAPAIDDVDNDGKVDIVAASTKGIYVFPLDANYSQNASLYPWPTFHHDNQRTGCATPTAQPINASIQGYVTKEGVPVADAKIYITFNDDAPVYEPGSTPQVARGYVLTVGSSEPSETRKGAFCISQLPPNSTYKIRVEAAGNPAKTVSDIAVTTGLVNVNVTL